MTDELDEKFQATPEDFALHCYAAFYQGFIRHISELITAVHKYCDEWNASGRRRVDKYKVANDAIMNGLPDTQNRTLEFSHDL